MAASDHLRSEQMALFNVPEPEPVDISYWTGDENTVWHASNDAVMPADLKSEINGGGFHAGTLKSAMDRREHGVLHPLRLSGPPARSTSKDDEPYLRRQVANHQDYLDKQLAIREGVQRTRDSLVENAGSDWPDLSELSPEDNASLRSAKVAFFLRRHDEDLERLDSNIRQAQDNVRFYGLHLGNAPEVHSDYDAHTGDAVDAVQQGKNVFYLNHTEDRGSVSVRAPRQNLRTWREHALKYPYEHPMAAVRAADEGWDLSFHDVGNDDTHDVFGGGLKVGRGETDLDIQPRLRKLSFPEKIYPPASEALQLPGFENR